MTVQEAVRTFRNLGLAILALAAGWNAAARQASVDVPLSLKAKEALLWAEFAVHMPRWTSVCDQTDWTANVVSACESMRISGRSEVPVPEPLRMVLPWASGGHVDIVLRKTSEPIPGHTVHSVALGSSALPDRGITLLRWNGRTVVARPIPIEHPRMFMEIAHGTPRDQFFHPVGWPDLHAWLGESGIRTDSFQAAMADPDIRRRLVGLASGSERRFELTNGLSVPMDLLHFGAAAVLAVLALGLVGAARALLDASRNLAFEDGGTEWPVFQVRFGPWARTMTAALGMVALAYLGLLAWFASDAVRMAVTADGAFHAAGLWSVAAALLACVAALAASLIAQFRLRALPLPAAPPRAPPRRGRRGRD